MINKFKFTGPFADLYIPEILTTGFFILLLLTFAIGVILIKHTERVLHTQLQKLHAEKEQLHNVWGQLTLEKATWMSDLRVEKVAQEQLHMVMPSKAEMIKP